MIGLLNWLVLVYVIKTFITENVFLPYIQSRAMKLNTFVCIDAYFTLVYSPISYNSYKCARKHFKFVLIFLKAQTINNSYLIYWMVGLPQRQQ